jgi:hypothetical protein
MVTLTNYLGTGSNPNLSLVLSTNGPGWNTYTIGYRATGNIPFSSDPSSQWSSWNVVDTDNNYYGTITLNCDGTQASWKNYVAGTEGYYLVNIGFPGQDGAYQLNVGSIVQPTAPGTGPFPNAPPAQPATYPGSTDPIILSVSGANIVNDKGATIVLKGVVRPSLEWNVQGQYLSPSDIQTMAGWGANVIRLDLNQAYWLSSADKTTIGSYKQIVDAMIYYATQNNMAVILDLHWIDSTTKQAPMANADSLTFWTDVATTYQGFGTVLFELYNEPCGITQDQWLNGGGGYTGYQALYDAVRATGAQNICIVGGLSYAYQLDFVSSSFGVTGSNIVYNSHPYNGEGLPGYSTGEPLFATNFQGILGSYPIIFTEFGGNQSNTYDDLNIYKGVVGYANQNGINYTAFAWWVQANNPAFPTLISSWNGTSMAGGTVVQADMKANPGTPLSTIPALRASR